MTRTTNARLAGFMFLLYIAIGITSLVLFNRATGGAEGTAATLASLARHETTVRLTVVIALLIFVIAVALAVSLYALTRDQDPDIALIALCCRVTEGVLAAVGAGSTMQLLAVATGSTAGGTPDTAALALGDLLLKQDEWGTSITATCFAVGSTLYCYLFLKARSIPIWLAWLGVVASVLLVVLLPAELAGLSSSKVTTFAWIPMAAFEVTLALWLIIKGVRLAPSYQAT